MQLTKLLLKHPLGSTPSTHALAALMCFNAARLPARVDSSGNLSSLFDQNRSQWDQDLVAEGLRLLDLSATGSEVREYHLQAGATIELLDIKELSVPMYDPANKKPPASVIKMCEGFYQVDGLIWSSPMYNGTISGSFKNALDWLILLGDRHPPYLTDKVVGLISTAGGMQGPAGGKYNGICGSRAPRLGGSPSGADRSTAAAPYFLAKERTPRLRQSLLAC
jgi:hypothetical protein